MFLSGYLALVFDIQPHKEVVMAKYLTVVGNTWNAPIRLTNTESEGDTYNIQSGDLVHTKGGGSNLSIPNCSGVNYFKDHHMLIEGADGLKIAFWTDDDADFVIHWSWGGTFDGANTVQGSNDYDECMLLFDSNGDPYFFPF